MFLHDESLLSGESGHDFDPPRRGSRLDDKAAVGGICPGQFKERTLELRCFQQCGSANRIVELGRRKPDDQEAPVDVHKGVALQAGEFLVGAFSIRTFETVAFATQSRALNSPGLVPAGPPDTRWRHDHVAGRVDVFTLRGRLQFGNGVNAAPFR